MATQEELPPTSMASMIGTSKRKASTPRKILRILLDDGTCELHIQKTVFKLKAYTDYYNSDSKRPCISDPYDDYGFDNHSDIPQKENENINVIDYYPNMQQSSPSSSTTSKAESPLQPKYDLEERHHKYSPEPKNGFRNKHQHPEPTRDFPYQCESCDMLFRSIDHLSDHQKTIHNNSRQFTCRFCNKRFNDKYNMRKHVLIHVGERRHKCQYCDKAFLRKDHLRSHLRTHETRKYRCKSCAKTFRQLEIFERHAQTHKYKPEMEIINESVPLSMSTPTKNDSTDHMSSESNDQMMSEDQKSISNSPLFMLNGNPKDEDTHCDLSTPNHTDASKSNEKLVVSVNIEKENGSDNKEDINEIKMEEETFSVTILDNDGVPVEAEVSPFGSNGNENNDGCEEILDTGKKINYSDFKCVSCNLSFHDKSKYEAHQKECANIKWQCRKCNIFFDDVNTLRQHYEKVHSFDKPDQKRSCWTCKQCVITFPNSKELSRHYSQYHKDAQIFPCSECPKTFTVWHNLKKHMLIHLGDKKHKCQYCDKGFVRKDHLNSHLKVHLGDGAKYHCPVCSKMFRVREVYLKHMNLHGLEKAYTVS